MFAVVQPKVQMMRLTKDKKFCWLLSLNQIRMDLEIIGRRIIWRCGKFLWINLWAGRTSVAKNLATAHTKQVNRRTLLIDCTNEKSQYSQSLNDMQFTAARRPLEPGAEEYAKKRRTLQQSTNMRWVTWQCSWIWTIHGSNRNWNRSFDAHQHCRSFSITKEASTLITSLDSKMLKAKELLLTRLFV